VVQRVKSAGVSVDGKIVSSIGNGLLCLVGIGHEDTPDDQEYIVRKILNCRLFTNEETGKSWDKSVMAMNYEVLCVSQFTLYGFLKGNKPDFHYAMPPDSARPFYEQFLGLLKRKYKPEAIKDGVFGAMMEVSLINDGPITMQFDSKKEEK